jgi:hypothetical protein
MVILSDDIARRAKQLLDDEVIQQAFASLEGRYINEWRNTPPADVQKREAAYAAIRALDDIKTRLGSMANAPKVEAHNNRNAAKR